MQSYSFSADKIQLVAVFCNSKFMFHNVLLVLCESVKEVEQKLKLITSFVCFVVFFNWKAKCKKWLSKFSYSD